MKESMTFWERFYYLRDGMRLGGVGKWTAKLIAFFQAFDKNAF